jgi:hypothetical protein
MKYQGKPCVVEVWDASQAVVKAPFGITVITAEFQEMLNRQLMKRGIPLEQKNPGSEVFARGKYVRVDAGNRFLRYFLTFLAGQAVIEVEGELIVKGNRKASLHAKAKQGWGAFGGNGESLLKVCAKTCGKKIAKQVASSLKRE